MLEDMKERQYEIEDRMEESSDFEKRLLKRKPLQPIEDLFLSETDESINSIKQINVSHNFSEISIEETSYQSPEELEKEMFEPELSQGMDEPEKPNFARAPTNQMKQKITPSDKDLIKNMSSKYMKPSVRIKKSLMRENKKPIKQIASKE